MNIEKGIRLNQTHMDGEASNLTVEEFILSDIPIEYQEAAREAAVNLIIKGWNLRPQLLYQEIRRIGRERRGI